MAEDKENPITLVATEEVDGKQKPFITYTFNRVGGSIGGVTLHNDIVDTQKVTDHNITINEAQNRGLENLVFNMDATQDPSYDNTVYKEVKRTADSVTLEGLRRRAPAFHFQDLHAPPRHGLFRKSAPRQQIHHPPDRPLLNKAPNVQDLRYLGIFAGSAYPIAKSEPKDTYTHLFLPCGRLPGTGGPSHFTGGFFQHRQAPRAGRPAEGPDLRRGNEPVLRHHPHSAGTVRRLHRVRHAPEFPWPMKTIPWCPA